MEEKIDGKMIFLVIIAGFLVYAFYHIIEAQERPQAKVTVSRILRQDFFSHKKQFNDIAAFADSVNSYSDEWYFENDPGRELQYFSETGFDSCKISMAQYVKRYYKKIDPSTSPCYVPDFDLPAELISLKMMDTLQLQKISFQRSKTCNKKTVSFIYKSEIFSPDGRTIRFRYFPDGMCREIIDMINSSDNMWNWTIYLDKNWIAESIKRNHI